jgi:hypothetical protein
MPISPHSGSSAPTRLRGVALLLAGTMLALAGRTAAAQPVPLLRETDAGIAVTTRAFTALISPANGGRITSFRYGGVEMTRMSPDGHGGLFEERHTADFRFSVVELTRTETEASVTLSADAGRLRVIKRYLFQADRPWFVVNATFENRSAYPIAGADGPAFVNVLLPAGADAPHLYCLNRGAGAEVLTDRVFLTSPGRPADGVLRWIAVADPASRRSVGMALQGSAAVLVPPYRTMDGALAFGWSYPALPAGRRLTTELAVVPCGAFSAIAELNRRFVVETLPAAGPDPLPMRFDIMSLAGPLKAVSIITRAYGADGRELAPCDPVLIPDLEPGRPSRAQIGQAGDGGRPALLLHEVYSEGRRLGAFHVSLAPAGRPAEPVPCEAPPKAESIEGLLLPAPGATIPVSGAAEKRGFLLWRFDGPAPTGEPEALEATLGEGERHAAFLGVRALREISRLRFTIAGVANGRDGTTVAVPPGASTLWQIEEGPDGAFMVPIRDMGLAAGDCVWLALTVDARGIAARTYSGRLVADADGVLWQIPLIVHVAQAEPLRAGAFGLWYVAADGAPLDDQSLAKLQDYGVGCLTAPEDAAGAGMFAAVAERGFQMVALSRGLGGLPPARAAGGLLVLAEPRPLWQVRAGVAPSISPSAAAIRGFATALSCERAETVPEEVLSAEHRYLALLVDDGCPLGAISDLYAGKRLSGDESVWLHLDVRGMDWRRAATELRSAMWAAGWQGLAGVAVTAPPPAREVDRQSVLWNIIRDARGEVARWRQTRQAMRAAPPGDGTPTEQVRARAIVESVVGVAEGCDLRLAPVRRPFRELLRVVPLAADEGLSLRAFRAAHRAVLRSATALPAAVDHPVMHWSGIPCVQDGDVLWAIAVGEGDAARERALALQKAIEEATGYRIPAARALPRGSRRGPRLVWVVGGGAPPEGWPEDVREAARRVAPDRLALVDMEGGGKAVVVGDEVPPERLTGTFRARAALYAVSRQVR